MPFSMERSDITKLNTDAIVNPANTSLMPGGVISGAVFAAAGYGPLSEACQKIGPCPVGRAVITSGYALPAKYIIHAVGPIWHDGAQGEDVLLRQAYESALALAEAQGCRSIAFPLLSTGPFGCPVSTALDIALAAIRDYLARHDLDVILTVSGRAPVLLGQARYDKLTAYLDANYLPEPDRPAPALSSPPPLAGGPKGSLHRSFRMAQCDGEASISLRDSKGPEYKPAGGPGLDYRLDHLEEPFSAVLLRMIDERGMKDTEVYKRANLDRRLFSKLRRPDYNPGKSTVLALAIALRLNLEETKLLLERAGYSLSPSSRFDVILQFCIENNIHDVFAVNEYLFACDERLLG